MSSSEIQKLKELLKNSYKQIQDLKEENEKLKLKNIDISIRNSKGMPEKPSITKNTKDNRVFVVANYLTESQFKIPDGLDLEDKSIVENWWVKHDTLYIVYADKDEIHEIEPKFSHYDYYENMGFKFPYQTYFCDYDWGCDAIYGDEE